MFKTTDNYFFFLEEIQIKVEYRYIASHARRYKIAG